MYIYIYIYVYIYIYIYIYCVYIYIYESGPRTPTPPPPNGMVPHGGGGPSLVFTRVLAAFLTTSLVLARFLQHF